MKPKLSKQQGTLLIFGLNKAGKQIFSLILSLSCDPGAERTGLIEVHVNSESDYFLQ